MKHFLISFLLFFSILSIFTACEEDQGDPYDPVAQGQADDKLIQEFIVKDTSVHNPVKTSSGLYYVKRKAGNGVQAKAGDIAKVHYIGKFLNGQVFESSYSTNSPFAFKVGAGQVIKGWDEGLQLMQEGETARFYIPSVLAYGQSASRTIPANTSLVFEITLLDVNP